MNILDFILVIPIVYFGYKGIRNGFIKRVMAILGIILGLLASYYYYEETSVLLSKYWEHSSVKYLAYIIPFILVVIVAKLIALITTKGLKFIALSPINMLLGAVFGIMQGVAISTIIALAVFVFNRSFETQLLDLTKESMLIGYSNNILLDILDYLAISI